MINLDDPKPSPEDVERIMSSYPNSLFEERVDKLMRRHGFPRHIAEEIVINVVTTKENRNG